MTTTVALPAPRWQPRVRTGLFRPEWPLVLICAGMPLTFLLGLHGFVWIVPVVVFGVQLLGRREPIVVPRLAIPLLLLVAWIPIPMLQLEPDQLPLALFRFLVFVSPLLCLLWIVNQPESVLPNARVVRLLALLWVTLIAFGFLAIAFPGFSTASPVQRMLPASILSNEYIRDLTSIQFAQVQSLVSSEVGRPAAPMAYSNGWGSTLGLLTPFFVLDFFVLANPRRRRYGLAIAIAALVPIILSLNRGLWLSLGVAFLYVALRRALQGSVKVALSVGVGVLLVIGVLAATTLGDTVQQRFEIASESNNARSALYEVAFDAAQERPLVGWGAPIDVDGLWKEVGTHGLVWFVMVSYGFPALVLLLAWMVLTLMSTARAPNPTALWAHVSIVVFIVQSPIYGLLPQIVLIGIAAAVALRAQQQGAGVTGPAVFAPLASRS